MTGESTGPHTRSGVDLDRLRLQVLPLLRELQEGRDPCPMVQVSPPRISVSAD